MKTSPPRPNKKEEIPAETSGQSLLEKTRPTMMRDSSLRAKKESPASRWPEGKTNEINQTLKLTSFRGVEGGERNSKEQARKKTETVRRHGCIQKKGGGGGLQIRQEGRNDSFS